MSRRSRKRRAAEGGSRWLGKAAVGLLALCLVLMGVAYLSLRSYLRSEGFRKFLAAQVVDSTGIEGGFAPFQWDGLAVDTRSFSGTGEGLLRSVEASDLHTEIGFGGIGRGVWEVKGSGAGRLEVSIDTRGPKDGGPADFPKSSRAAKEKPAPWYPHKAELEGIRIGRLTVHAALDEGTISARDLAVGAERTGNGGDYRVEIDGGVIRTPYDFLPELRLESARLRYSDGRVFLTKSRLAAWETGHIDAAGEWDSGSKRFSLDGAAGGLKCADIFTDDWAKRLTGDAESTFTLGNSSGTTTASGELVVRNGTITALPLLDALAAYADTRRFRVLTLSDSRTRWRWRKGEIELSDLVISSEGLVRLEGVITIRGREIDGLFRLGLAPGTLSTIPGAETDVFMPGPGGLLWTSLKIGGTLDKPTEDLTDRLFDAAGARMFEQLPESGEKVLRFGSRVLGESPEKLLGKGVKTLDKGVEILGRGSRAIDDVGGILDGFFGRDETPEGRNP